MTIRLYTDGAASGNGYTDARGGYGYYIEDDNGTTQAGYGPITGDKVTNNVAELSAVVMGLHKVLTMYPNASRDMTPIELYSDSAYFVNCINQKWYIKWQNNGWFTSARTPVENRGLWEEILKLLKVANIRVYKVKGHKNNKGNIYADKLAVLGKTAVEDIDLDMTEGT